MAKILQMLFNLDIAVTGLKQLQSMEQQFHHVSEAGQKLGAVQKQMGAFQTQQTAVASSASRLETLRTKLNEARTATQSAKLASANLNVQYAQAQSKVAELTAQFGRKSIQVKQARQDMLNLKRAYQQSEVEVKRLAREEQGLESQVKRAGEALTSERDKLAQMREGLKQAGITTRNFSQRQKEMEQAMNRLTAAQQRYNNIKSKLSYANFKSDLLQSAATAMAFKAPVQASMKFEQAMLDVAAVARPTAEEFTRLSEQAKFLGRTTQYTSVQAAEAQQNLIRSGMSIDQVIKAMPSVLQLASAEGLSIEDAGKFIAKGLGGMNLGGEMAGRLADVLSYASAHANTDVTMLSEAFKVAAPTLSSQSYTMEEVATYLGILANKGFEGSEAGNALSSSMQRLAILPKSAQEAFAKLRLSPRDEKGEALKLPELMIRLYNRLKDKTEVQQLEYLSLIFGKNYGKQMISFMRATAEGQTKTLENGVWNESFGWSKQSTDIRMNSLNGDITALSSAWDGLMTRIGESLNPVVRIGVQWITAGINGLTSLINYGGTFSDIVIRIAGGFAAWKVVATVYKYASLLVQLPFAKFGLSLAEAGAKAALSGEKFALFPAIIGKISAGFSALGAVLMAHPIIAIGTLVAAGVALAIANWEKLKAWWNSWNPAPKTALEIQQTEAVKKEFVAKHGTVDFRPSYMKTASPPVAKPYAFGGILTTPHIGLVAEAGPEAVIPLSNKSRGIPLLEKAANLLGLTVNNSAPASITANSHSETSSIWENVTEKIPQIFSRRSMRLLNFSRNFSQASTSLENFSSDNNYSVKSAGDFIGQRLTFANSQHDNYRPVVSAGQAPVINITVNGAGQESRSLAEDIAAKVREVLREIYSLEERVSFA